MKIYIAYHEGQYYHVKRLNGEAKPKDPRKYSERGYKDFCQTAIMKQDHIITLPFKPTEELEKMIQNEYRRVKR